MIHPRAKRLDFNERVGLKILKPKTCFICKQKSNSGYLVFHKKQKKSVFCCYECYKANLPVTT